MNQEIQNIQLNSIHKSLAALLFILKQYESKGLDLERLCRVALILKKCGLDSNNVFLKKIANQCIDQQKSDGGWISVEDSIWASALIQQFNEQSYKDSLKWLRLQELDYGGWGRSKRDIARIPITGLLLFLLPELSNQKNLAWLENEWQREFGFNPKLTYKAAFYILAMRSSGCALKGRKSLEIALDWLVTQQNDDFGWGPWRGHPVGSSPFCTGVALVGLLQYPDLVDRQVIINGLEWIQKNQLENGLWADHYIEEGSAWCFYALTEGYRFLQSHP